MSSPIEIRPVFGRVMAVLVALLVAYSLASLILAGDTNAVLRYAWPLLLFGFVLWLAFWQPRVTVGEKQVRLVNVFRTITVPFASITRVDTRFALTLMTTGGRFTAWAAPAPGRHAAARTDVADAKNLPASSYQGGTVRPGDVPRTESGDAATIIRQRLAEFESTEATDGAVGIRIHLVSLVVIAVLVIGTVLGAVL